MLETIRQSDKTASPRVFFRWVLWPRPTLALLILFISMNASVAVLPLGIGAVVGLVVP